METQSREAERNNPANSPMKGGHAVDSIGEY